MPKIHRSMLVEGGKPKVGSESKVLGVRIAPSPNADIPVDENGNVHPHTGGMSVAPEWRNLKAHLIPKRLRHLSPGARGRDDLVCWVLGQGDFKEEGINDQLALRPDANASAKHGAVEPAYPMPIAEYQAALAATRDDWVEDEN